VGRRRGRERYLVRVRGSVGRGEDQYQLRNRILAVTSSSMRARCGASGRNPCVRWTPRRVLRGRRGRGRRSRRGWVGSHRWSCRRVRRAASRGSACREDASRRTVPPVASTSPRCASEVTSRTPVRPRAVRSRENPSHPRGAVLGAGDLQPEDLPVAERRQLRVTSVAEVQTS
jgi:hypothetical protein